MSTRVNVIYARYSSDMQRPDSCADQERDVRRDLPRYGVDPAPAVVLKDEAESGTRAKRDGGFETLCAMIGRGEVGVLAVDDQARLSRADNASQFIKDLVYAGGRFISTGEGIDTDQPGWELRVKVMELHNSHTVRELAHRVRRGQEGRVLDDGSAGDFPFGYESFYLDPDWEAQLRRRGPKPKKGLRACEAEARWVRQVFAWFINGQSINAIARQLTDDDVSKGGRASTDGWHPQQVRRMLANEKYVGRWVWGATTTLRNSSGDKKQVPTPEHKRAVRDRPELRIIDPDTWDRAQRRLAELKDKFGLKDGHKRRGPMSRSAEVYPRSPLGGLLVCAACGAAFHFSGSGGRRYYACSGHKKGLCPVATRVPAVPAEAALIGFLTDLLSASPEWLTGVYRRVRELVRLEAERQPERHAHAVGRLADVRRQTGNLVRALADARCGMAAVEAALAELQREADRLEVEVARGEARPAVELPGDEWLAARLRQWAVVSETVPDRVAVVLRQAVGPVAVEAVVPPGKKRGRPRLRFRVNEWAVLRGVLGDRLPQVTGPSDKTSASPEFVLDLGSQPASSPAAEAA